MEKIFIFMIKNSIPSQYQIGSSTIKFKKNGKPVKVIKFWPIISEIQEYLFKMGVHKAQLCYSVVTGQIVLVYFINDKEVLVSINEHPSHLENLLLLKKWVENEKNVRCCQLKISFSEKTNSHE